MQNNYLKSPNSSSIDREDSAFEADLIIIDRARSYVARMEEAVSGEEGHKTTFKVACALVRVFNLAFGDVYKLLLEYNERCEPKWTLDELRHKAADACRLVDPLENSDLLEMTRSTNPKPFIQGFQQITSEQVHRLSALRNIPAVGIALASINGFLISGMWHGNECYALRDFSGNAIELRRLDGQNFAAVPEYNLRERKSHALRGSRKGWPVGILEAESFPCIALVEGIPDFLFAHYKILQEHVFDRVAVVAMLSASPSIIQDALRACHAFFARKVCTK